MNEKNRTGGPPKPFDKFAVKAKFPEGRPIFWGGEQDTNNPDTYVEPNKVPPDNSLMSIPQVIRFVVGGVDVEDDPNPPTGFMIEVQPLSETPLVTGITTISQNVQLIRNDFNINLGPPRFGLFWRIIEYKIVMPLRESPAGTMTFHEVLKTGSFDEDGNVVGGDATIVDGEVFISTSGDTPISSGPNGSGSYQIIVFFTVQFSSDGVFWTTYPLSDTYPPVP